MIFNSSFLQIGAILGESLEAHVDTYYRPEFDRLRQDLGIEFGFAAELQRVIVTTVVLAPMRFSSLTAHLNGRFSENERIPLDNDGHIYIESIGVGTLVFYLVLPVSVMGLTEEPGSTRRRRRRARRTSAAAAQPTRAMSAEAKEKLLHTYVAQGRFEEAAQLRDDIRRLRGEPPLSKE